MYNKPRYTVFVHNLGFSENETTVKRHFEKAGLITNVEMIRDSVNRTRGFAYVTYEDSENAKLSIDMFNNTFFNDRRIYVQFVDGSSSTSDQKSKYDTIVSKLDQIIDLLTPDRPIKRRNIIKREVIEKVEPQKFLYTKPIEHFTTIIPIGLPWLIESTTKTTLSHKGHNIIVEVSDVDEDNKNTHYPCFLFNGINEEQGGNRWATSSHQDDAFVFILFDELVEADLLIMTARDGSDCLQAPDSFEIFGVGKLGKLVSLQKFIGVKWAPNLKLYFKFKNKTKYFGYKIVFYSCEFKAKYFGLAELNLGKIQKKSKDDESSDDCLIC